MKRIVLALLFVVNIVVAQEEITMNLGDFHTVKTYRGLQVELKKGDAPKIVIDGPKSSEVSVKNNNGVLKISMNITHTFSAEDVMVYLYYSKKIDVIDANEGSHIFSEDVFKQNKLKVNAQEAGHITLKLDTEELEVVATTGGMIKLDGESVRQRIKVNTGGIYKGEELKTENADISANTGGLAYVHATKFADAGASTGGMITLTGDPEEVKKSESLGGYVKQ
jgi:hypothetical protein